MKPFALLLGCGALTLAGVAQASTPVQISLPGVNLPSSNQVEGARASFLYGRTGQVELATDRLPDELHRSTRDVGLAGLGNSHDGIGPETGAGELHGNVGAGDTRVGSDG